MALTSYTSAAEVRSVLGVSAKELADTIFALPIRETELREDLNEISAGLNADFLTTSAIAEADRTAVQDRFVKLTQLFSAYSVGKTLMSSQPMFSPKRITDGKAEVERFEDAYGFIRDALNINFANFKAKLAAAYAAFGGTVLVAPSRVYFQVSSGADPVTGA